MENPWKTLDLEVVYENRWLRVTHSNVINPSGGYGIYGVVHFKNIAIGIIPVDEEGYTWLVGQYRYAINRYTWEIPEGGCPEGEEPLLAAQRELQEETGLTADHWEELLRTDMSNSVTDERGIIYLARNPRPGPSAPEATEDITVRRLPLTEAIAMVRRGEITDALSVVALLWVASL